MYGACYLFGEVRMMATFVSLTSHRGPYMIKHLRKGQVSVWRKAMGKKIKAQGSGDCLFRRTI